MSHNQEEKSPFIFKSAQVEHWIIVIYVGIVLVYFSWWLDFRHAGNWVLYGLLLLGEVYHVWQALGYAHTIWDQKPLAAKPVKEPLGVDVFITMCGEPIEVLEKNIQAALRIDYPNFKIHVLNDNYTRNYKNWKEVEEVGKKYGVDVITRKIPGGGKPGNINHGLRNTDAPLFALFDVDHIPERNFLKETVGHFEDPKMAVVQTPQYYSNRNYNYITQAAWEQQELFFGPLCRGKNRFNATFWCGTNAVIRRAAIEDIGGIREDNIAEDFLASLFLHEKGWKSAYVGEVLSQGVGPSDLKSYTLQQFRWARGSLEIIFKYNPLFQKGLTWAQKMQYLYSSGYYLNGIVVLIDALVPIVVLVTGILPVKDTTGNFMAYFFPFMFGTLYLLVRSTRYTITFRAIQMTMSTFFIFFLAAISAILNRKVAWNVTPKEEQTGNFLKNAIPAFVYVALGGVAIGVAAYRDGLVPSVMANTAWVIFNCIFFFSFIRVGYPWRKAYVRVRNKLKEYVSQPMKVIKDVDRISETVKMSTVSESESKRQ